MRRHAWLLLVAFLLAMAIGLIVGGDLVLAR
jgi:hypothetical protein